MSTYVSLADKGVRNQNIQLVRGLAIIAVVMIHTTPGGIWPVFIRPFINFCVATFIFLSGYLTKMENESWGTFYKKRITRVMIPYLVWSVIYSGFLTHFNPKAMLLQCLAGTAMYTFYFIFVYVQFVLLTPLIARLAKSKYHWAGWLVSPLSMLVLRYCVLFCFGSSRFADTCLKFSCLSWFTYYYLGLMLGNGRLKRSYPLKRLIVFLVLSLILQMAEDYVFLLAFLKDPGTQLKISSLITNTLFLFCVHTLFQRGFSGIKSRLLVLLGDFSFGIYLCHPGFILLLGRDVFPFPLNSIAILLVSLVFCYVGKLIFGKKLGAWLGFY